MVNTNKQEEQTEKIQAQFDLFIEEAGILVPPCNTRVFLDSRKQFPICGHIRTPLLKDIISLTEPIDPYRSLASINNALPQVNFVYTDFRGDRVFLIDYCRALAVEDEQGYCTESGSYVSALSVIGQDIENAGYRSAQTFRGANPDLKWIEILGIVPEESLREHAKTFGRINSSLDTHSKIEWKKRR